MSGTRLTDEQCAEAVRLYRDGMTLRRVADSFGCHHTTVQRAVLRAGERPRATNGEHRSDSAPIAGAIWRGRAFEVFASGVSRMDDGRIACVVRIDDRPGPILFRLVDGWIQRQGSHPLHRANEDVPASLTRQLDAWLAQRGAA